MESGGLPVPEHPERPTPAIRISDAERDTVINQLRHAMGEGRIDLAEFEERSSVVYNARFEQDLEPVLADLPTVAAPPAPMRAPAVDRRWMVCGMSGREWRGSWRPARQNVVLTVMGGQEIDLTSVDATDIEIVAFTMMGGIEMTVPRGALVDDGGFFVMGSSTTKLDPPEGTPVMRVRIRSYGLMGSSEVFHPKKKKRKNRAELE